MSDGGGAAVKRKKGGDGSKKKKKSKSTKPFGTVLFCGSSAWAASVDAKDDKKIFETPHKFAAMAGRQVSKVVMGPVALSGVIITKQGSAFTFGRNVSGQLGLGDEKTRTFPRKIDGLSNIVDAACGRHHTLFLDDKGRIYATGMNISGQLGLGDKKIEAVNTPKRVPFDFGGKVIKVACGADFSCALTESGLVYAWGHPDKGCLGNGTDGKYFITASKLTFHFEFAPILVSGWCVKEEGMLGEGREKAEMQPVPQPKIIDVACGPEHTIALAEDGNVFSWGFGGYGRLGHNSPENETHPRLIEHFKPTNPHTKGACSLSVGGSCAIVMTNALKHPYFWGQLKSSGEATMYPKIYHEGMSEEQMEHCGLGHKHVVLATNNNTYALGSSPCYGELGYGDGEKRSSTLFKPMAPIGPIPMLGVACGFAQTLLIADTSTVEARKAMYQLPTLGTLSEIHTLNELIDEFADSLEDENYVVMLDNLQQIVETIGDTDDTGTLKKLRGNVDKLNGAIKEMFANLTDGIATGEYVPTGPPKGPAPDEGLLETATAYVQDLIEKHGTNTDEIAASLTGMLTEKIMG